MSILAENNKGAPPIPPQRNQVEPFISFLQLLRKKGSISCDQFPVYVSRLMAVRVRARHVGPVEGVSPERGSAPLATAATVVAAGLTVLVEVGLRRAADAGVVDEDTPATNEEKKWSKTTLTLTLTPT